MAENYIYFFINDIEINVWKNEKNINVFIESVKSLCVYQSFKMVPRGDIKLVSVCLIDQRGRQIMKNYIFILILF